MSDKRYPSTQEHLDIIDIKDGYVLLKDGAARVISPSAVNFDLLSPEEQDAMIGTFAGLLNSLTFPIQIIIRTRWFDIHEYLEKLDDHIYNQPNPFLKEKMLSYKKFILDLTARKDVLNKSFYLIIPYKDQALKSKGGFMGLGGTSKVNTARLLARAKDYLEPKVEQMTRQLVRFGVEVEVLETQELVELFYNIYNPTVAREERIESGTAEYTAPLVEGKVDE